MKKCINELDALNEINKKLRSIFWISVCCLVIVIFNVPSMNTALWKIYEAVEPPHPMQPLHGDIDEPSPALNPSRPDDE